MAQIDLRNPPNEMPDIVGYKPDNPLAANFKPDISARTRMRELTPLPLIVGTLLGIIFGASSLYLVLKVGLTVSASIPVAVISITLFRLLSKVGLKDATILENNIEQTAGSAGESIAFGVGVTMPAIMILGLDLEVTRVMLVAMLGGLLGILMMIPLRRALIVAQHGYLKYPEGTACAEVLKAGASDESRAAAHRAGDVVDETEQMGAKTIFAGLGVGFLYQVLMTGLKGWKDTPEKVFGAPFKAGSISAEISPALLGVGYISGPRIASIMCAGGVLAYLVLIPAIKFFGSGMTTPLAPGTVPISEMSPSQIRGAYILYIGAGAVAAGGIISLFRSLPTIWHGLKGGLADLRGGQKSTAGAPRTDQDMSMKVVMGGIIVLIALIMLFPQLNLRFNLIGAILIVAFGFLFVTVSSRLTGEIGSSSNPISGMTVATLLLTCLIFLVIGWTGPSYYITALSVGGIVCIASSNGGTTSQDLKTGFLVGATPKYQQIAILIGALASALVLGPILKGLNDVRTVFVPAEKVSPGMRVMLPNENVTTRNRLVGPQASEDTNSYWAYYQLDPASGTAKKFLLDDSGKAVWYADPGINGTFEQRPDGSKVEKFTAPKAVLMSDIINAILNRKLPCALVLFGVMISVTLELSAIPSLAFAVGVYLPLSSSAPLFVGGLIRWLVDRRQRAQFKDTALTEAQLAAESDKSPGVLLSSGYIAGGAITGIVVAFMEGLFPLRTRAINEWSQGNNPFYSTAD